MILTLVILAIALTFGLGAVLGAPYVPILHTQRDELLDLAALKPGQTIIDLGSGDGRFLRAAAARGLTAIGYEINPLLVAVSWAVCFRYRQRVSIHLSDFWRQPLPPADVIYVFLIDRYMPKLRDKLRREITRPTRVVCYVFELPGETAIKHNRNTHIYQFGGVEKLRKRVA
jgi:hypothetical protein